MLDLIKKFEKVVIIVLIIMLALIIMFSIVDLVWILIKDLMTPPVLMLEIHELLDLFGLILLVLIGIELLETMKKYYAEGRISLSVIIAVSLIALGRKIIIMDPKQYNAITLLGMAAIIAALFFGYWVIRTTNRKPASPDVVTPESHSKKD